MTSPAFKLTWPKSGFKPTMGGVLQAAKIATTDGMRFTTDDLKHTIRRQIEAAGMGTRLANTVRGVAYPKGVKKSLNAAGTVFFKAPHIIRTFEEGAVIRPKNGPMLAIPLPECPKGPRGRRMSPADAEARFGEARAYQTPSGKVVLSFFVVAAKSQRRPGWRKPTASRAKQGRQGAWVPFYVLIRVARLPKKLDLAGALAEAGARLKTNIAAAWPHEVDEL